MRGGVDAETELGDSPGAHLQAEWGDETHLCNAKYAF